MDKVYHEFNKLVSGAISHLVDKLYYSPSTVGGYKHVYRKLREFMLSKHYSGYSKSVGEQFLLAEFNGLNRYQVGSKYNYFHAVQKLDEFMETGAIRPRNVSRRYPIVFQGPFKEIIEKFTEYLAKQNKAIYTIRDYSRHLYDLAGFCENTNTNTLEAFDMPFLLSYIHQYPTPNKSAMISLIRCLRGFLKYLYQTGQVKINFAEKLPSPKIVLQPKIPSIYTEEEIQLLLKSVERATAVGKRNYVMIILAVRMGLRASDIAGLRFDHIDWEKSTIEIIQYKTGKQLALPLLPDVGNAIIDYLKYGRPKSDSPFILLRGRPPYKNRASATIVTSIVQRNIRKAGLRKEGRRFGAHALRHSLGFRLLENSTALHVITEVFGHKNSSSTKYYLRIDIQSMRQCMLEVPDIPDRFYRQRGGLLYG